jgi:enamine deaminase RidA (YjgF/YER057c/UK114 family)
MSDQQILARLSELGLELPPPPRAVASYVPVRVSGKLAFVAGQVPMVDGVVMHAGRLGEPSGEGDEVASVTVEQGAEAARQGALQALAALGEALGSFERLAGIVQVTVYVWGEPGFGGHPAVANGASDLLVDLLGEAGRHARAAVGVASLPLGASVEVAVTAELA